MPSALPEAILFDLDGTLADTAPDLGTAANRLRKRNGLPPLPLHHLRPHTSHGVRGMLHAAFGIDASHKRYTELSEQFLELYAERLCAGTRLFDGIPELLAALETRSIKWGVVTNKRQRYTNPLMAALGLDERASCIISGDSTEHPKPAPDALLMACRIADVNPGHCLYVGDDLRDIVAGKAAGMRTVAAAYGYLGVEVPVAAWEADAIIQSPRELLTMLAIGAW